MSFDFAQDEVRCRWIIWRAPLILSEVEGSSPTSAVGQFFHTRKRGPRVRVCGCPWTPAFAGATARSVIRDEVTRLARAVEARLLQELIGLRRHRLDRLGDLGGVAVEAGVDIGGNQLVGQLALDLLPRRQDGLHIELHFLWR